MAEPFTASTCLSGSSGGESSSSAPCGRLDDTASAQPADGQPSTSPGPDSLVGGRGPRKKRFRLDTP